MSAERIVDKNEGVRAMNGAYILTRLGVYGVENGRSYSASGSGGWSWSGITPRKWYHAASRFRWLVEHPSRVVDKRLSIQNEGGK